MQPSTLGQAEPGRSWPRRAEQIRAKPGRAESESNEAEPSPIEHSGAEPSWVRLGQPKPSRSRQGGAHPWEKSSLFLPTWFTIEVWRGALMHPDARGGIGMLLGPSEG